MCIVVSLEHLELLDSSFGRWQILVKRLNLAMGVDPGLEVF